MDMIPKNCCQQSHLNFLLGHRLRAQWTLSPRYLRAVMRRISVDSNGISRYYGLSVVVLRRSLFNFRGVGASAYDNFQRDTGTAEIHYQIP